MVTIGDEEARTLLEEERTRLQQIRTALSGESPDGPLEEQALAELSVVDQHPADVGTEMFERSRDLSILQHIDDQLADVEHAVERLRKGTYGTCEACGRPIDEDRLRARPAARFCVDDQALREKAGP
ncbi:MAG TPA: TraR/DksA C4-type zinc finger protein [Actinomycetota bacterium]|nr:TraR/DksA C4-type zinc finger protein [Actinomycetota bacterium]